MQKIIRFNLARQAVVLLVVLAMVTGLLVLPAGTAWAGPLDEPAAKKPSKTIYMLRTNNTFFKTKGFSFTGLSFTRKPGSRGFHDYAAWNAFYMKWYPTEQMGIFSAKGDEEWVENLRKNSYLDRIIFCLEPNEIIKDEEPIHAYRDRTKEGLEAIEKAYYANKEALDFAGQVDAYMERYLPDDGLSGALRQYAIWTNMGQVVEKERLKLASKPDEPLDNLVKDYDLPEKTYDDGSIGYIPEGNKIIYSMTTEAHLMGLRSKNHPALSFDALGDGVYELKNAKGFAVPGTYTLLPEGAGASMDEEFAKPLDRDNPMVKTGDYPLRIRLKKGKEIKDIPVKIIRPNYAMDQEWVVYGSPRGTIEESDQLLGKPITAIVNQEETVTLSPVEAGGKTSEEDPKTSEEDPKAPEEDPKASEEDPKASEEDPKTSEEDPKTSEENPKDSEENPTTSDNQEKPEDPSKPDGGKEKPEDPPKEDKPGTTDKPGEITKPDNVDKNKDHNSGKSDKEKKPDQEKDKKTPDKKSSPEGGSLGERMDQPGGTFSPLDADGKLKDDWWTYAKYYDPDSKDNLWKAGSSRYATGSEGSRKASKKSPDTGEGVAILPLAFGSGLSGLGIFCLTRRKKER